MDARCEVQLLGSLRVAQGDHVITRFRDRKTAALFAYLVYFRRRPHPREELIYLFWPESDERAGRASLSTSLSMLHKQLEPPGTPKGTLLQADRSTVQCNPDAFTTDVAAFEVALQRASRFRDDANERCRLQIEAIAYYAGELLPGFYDDWILTERIRLQTIYLDTLTQIVAAFENAGEFQEAIAYAQRIVTADALHEEAHETLIRLYAAIGQTDAARRQDKALTRILQNETGWTEKQKTQNTKHKTEPPAALHPAPCTLYPTPAPRLPLRLTRFFGRNAEIATLCERLVAGNTRLLTITGSGGNGKTRISIEVAERLLPDWNGNVCFVALAEITAANLIPDAIRDALRLPREPGTEPLEQIVNALNEKPALLVLDNFEQLLSEAEPTDGPAASVALVQTLLNRVPTLTCLVTSRQILDIGGEQEFALLPLPTPEQGVGCRVQGVGEKGTQDESEESYTLHPTPHTLLNYPSVRLFVDRAQKVKPHFQITEHNAAAIATLCDKLEGIPLALELAAARAQVMTPAQMVRQLEAPFDFLASRRKDLAPRHQTLFKAIDWSYRLLSPPFRDFFARLSAFRGGWTLEAAEAVAILEDDPDERAERISGLDFLAQLRHLSLILAEEDGEAMRFRMLEMIRTFATFQLSPQERDELQRRHADYFLERAETAEDELNGPQQKIWLECLEAEHENLRAALRFLIEAQETQKALRLSGALGRFWWVRGHRREGQEWLRQAMALPKASAPTLARAKVLRWYGFFFGFQNKGRPERSYYEESLTLFRQHDHRLGMMETLLYLGDFSLVAGQLGEAEVYYRECQALAAASGEKSHQAKAHIGLAHLAEHQSDRPAYLFHLESSLALHRELKNPRGIALSLLKLGRYQDDLEARKPYFEEGLTLFREIGDAWGIGSCLHAIAGILLATGKIKEAIPLYEEARTLFRALGANDHLVSLYTTLAEARFRLGERETAFALLDEIERITDNIDAPRRCGVLVCRALLRFENGETPLAIVHLREICALEPSNPRFNYYHPLYLCARIAIEKRLPEHTIRAIAAMEAQLLEFRARLHAFQQPVVADCLARARQLLPCDEDFQTRWEEGFAFSREDALRCIHAILDA